MTTETKVLGSILIATVVLLVGGVFLLSRGNSGPTGIEGVSVSRIDYTKGQKIGSDSAKVRLVEFSDFQCPACKAAEPIIKQVLSKYPENLQFIYRHFPLPQHKNGRVAINLAEEASRQGKFWPMHDLILDTQERWSELGDPTEFFLELSGQLNLDKDQVKKALAEKTFDQLADQDLAEGRNLGVNSTPTFFLNGRKLNLQGFDDLNTVVANELKK